VFFCVLQHGKEEFTDIEDNSKSILLPVRDIAATRRCIIHQIRKTLPVVCYDVRIRPIFEQEFGDFIFRSRSASLH